MINIIAVENINRLNTLYATQLLDTPPEAAFDRLTALVTRTLGVPVALISLIDKQRQFIKSSVGLVEPLLSKREIPLTHSFCKHTTASRQPLVIPNALEHPLVFDNPAIRDMNVLAYASVPLITTEGYVLGTLCAIDHKPRRWLAHEISILSDLAQSVMSEINLRAASKERAEIESRLRSYTKELETVNVELDAYGHTIAHDLKAPLNAILGFAGLIQMETPDLPQSAQESLNQIISSGEMMSNMIEQLLNLAKLSDGDNPAHPMDIMPLVGAALMRFSSRFYEREIDFAVEGELYPGLGHAPWIEEIFANLIGNAINYLDDSRTGIIRVRSSVHGSNVRYEVQDNGVGIKPDDRDRLFRMFTRLHTVKDANGFGLGLSIINRMVKRMNGTVGVESEWGEGSTFWFTLPLPPEFDADVFLNYNCRPETA